MSGPINHEVISEDGLNKVFYQYWFRNDTFQLVLDHYRHENKPTKRHNWRVTAKWDRLEARYWESDNTRIKRDAIPNLDTVRVEVLRKFVEQITID